MIKMKKTFGGEETTSDLGPPDQNVFYQMILFLSNDKNEKTFGREETISDLGPPDQNVFCKKCNMYKNVTNKIKELKGYYTIDVQ
jgi:hypothetical protein